MLAKIIVMSVVAAVVCARPGYLDTYPAATSHVSRIDVHAKPLVSAAYSSPYYGGYGLSSGHGLSGYGLSGYGLGGYGVGGYGLGGYGLGGYGLGYGNGYGHGYGQDYGNGYPLAHSYSNRIDFHGAPVSSGYGHLGYGNLGNGYSGWSL